MPDFLNDDHRLLIRQAIDDMHERLYANDGKGVPLFPEPTPEQKAYWIPRLTGKSVEEWEREKEATE